MDAGSNGYFQKVFDGRNQPGIIQYNVTELIVGRAYRFKVRALNFNGAGDFSSESVYYSCLPPQEILPPQYVSSTETSLKVKWGAPQYLYGCPLVTYNMYVDDGENGLATNLVAAMEPHINYLDITTFAVEDTSKVFTMTIEAVTAAGSVTSGTN